MSRVDAAWSSGAPPFLRGIDCDFQVGVNLVVGPLASGKTLMLLSKSRMLPMTVFG